MKKKCNYVTLKFVPKIFSEEFINCALIFHNISDGELYINKIKNLNRVKSFADDVDINEFSKKLDNIEVFLIEESKKDIFRVNNVNIFSDNFFESIRNMFLSNFQLGNIVKIMSDNPRDDFDELNKIFLYYDFDKKVRPSEIKLEDSIKKMAKKTIINNIPYKNEYAMDVNYENISGEKVKYDFKIGNHYFKIFNPLSASDSYSMKYINAKVWAYNSKYIANDDKVIFILTDDYINDESRIVLNILKKGDAEIIHFDEFIKYIDNLNYKLL